MKKLWNLAMKTWRQYQEQIAYLFFGGVTTLVNIVALEIFARLGCATWLANAIAWVLSVLTAYVTNRLWVFHSDSTGASAVKEIGSFFACRTATFVLDEAIMVVGVDKLHLWRLGVKIFANVLVIILNYVFSKVFIFKKREQGTGNREQE